MSDTNQTTRPPPATKDTKTSTRTAARSLRAATRAGGPGI